MKMSLRLVNGGIVLALVVVLLGGWTRLNDAGLGCPDWPACYGHLVLPAADQVADRIAPHYPGHQVDLKKGWLEMIHRYVASLLGLLILVQALWHWHQRGERLLASGLLALVLVQGLFGMWTVTLKLVPWVVTLHLLGGVATLGLLVRLRQKLKRRTRDRTQERPAPAVRWLLAVLLLQLMLGGWTSSNYAGWACDSWWQCSAREEVQYDFAAGLNPLQAVGPNYEGGLLPAPARAAIQMTHRLGALLVVAVLIWASVSLRHQSRLRPWLGLCWLLTGGQMLLGILNVVWLLPLGLAVAHHFGAVLLWLAVLGLYERAHMKRTEVIHGYLFPG